MSEDALHHASQAFHAQLTAVKIENSQLKSALDQEGRKTEELNEKVNKPFHNLVKENLNLPLVCTLLKHHMMENIKTPYI